MWKHFFLLKTACGNIFGPPYHKDGLLQHFVHTQKVFMLQHFVHTQKPLSGALGIWPILTSLIVVLRTPLQRNQ